MRYFMDPYLFNFLFFLMLMIIIFNFSKLRNVT